MATVNQRLLISETRLNKMTNSVSKYVDVVELESTNNRNDTYHRELSFSIISYDIGPVHLACSRVRLIPVTTNGSANLSPVSSSSTTTTTTTTTTASAAGHKIDEYDVLKPKCTFLIEHTHMCNLCDSSTSGNSVSKDALNRSLTEYAKKCRTELECRLIHPGCDIIIENQPPQATMNVMLEDCLAGMWSGIFSGLTKQFQIHRVSAKAKWGMEQFEGETRKRKIESKRVVTELLTQQLQDNDTLSRIRGYGKFDDVADSILQACEWLARIYLRGYIGEVNRRYTSQQIRSNPPITNYFISSQVPRSTPVQISTASPMELSPPPTPSSISTTKVHPLSSHSSDQSISSLLFPPIDQDLIIQYPTTPSFGSGRTAKGKK